MRTRAEHRLFDGRQLYFEHESAACAGPMRFSVYLPPAAAVAGTRVPAVYYLPGLTCTDETFPTKAGAQRVAAELGLALVACDTSPRAARFAGDDADWDFGQGAGFYLDATQAPWAERWRMESYVTRELPQVLAANFPWRSESLGLFGHSMGGHGALTLALRHPGAYRSVSAFAPVAAPMQCPWGVKAFTNYLGDDRSTWGPHDATELVKSGARAPAMLVDQGLADKFLAEQLHVDLFEAACRAARQSLTLRRHDGYDHGYFFIASFIEDHLRFHADALKA